MSDTDLARGSSQIGDKLRQARRAADLTQAEAAELLGVNPMTISKRERGERGISAADFAEALAAYESAAESRAQKLGLSVPRGTGSSVDFLVKERGETYLLEAKAGSDEDSWSPNPALVNKIPTRAYNVALEYCRRLQRNAWPREEIEQIERLMIDPRYAQANKRKGHELSEDDHIMLIDATWEAVKATAAALGRQV